MYMQVRYIEVLFHIFDHHWGKETRSFYRGLRLVEVRYIEVPLYLTIYIAQCLRLRGVLKHIHNDQARRARSYIFK